MKLHKIFYAVKPLIPRSLQLALRRQLIKKKRAYCGHIWPIDPDAANPPENWQGWPYGKQFSLVLTHDVDTAAGQNKCMKLMELEKQMGFVSSFNFVPERYSVSPELRAQLVQNGFEVGVHGLLHDGKLYSSRKVFTERARKINQYIKQWEAVGFRSPAMHHNLEWIHDLKIQYDASTFDTDPFEPQSDGLGTIFPQWIKNGSQGGYVELPYTLAQDFTVFILMGEKDISIWQKKLDWIAENGGMALINTHPDYMRFSQNEKSRELFPVELYQDFLRYIKTRYEGRYWHVLARNLAAYCTPHAGQHQQKSQGN